MVLSYNNDNSHPHQRRLFLWNSPKIDVYKRQPQTSCPSPAQYLDAFDCGADELYVVTLSACLLYTSRCV